MILQLHKLFNIFTNREQVKQINVTTTKKNHVHKDLAFVSFFKRVGPFQ